MRTSKEWVKEHKKALQGGVICSVLIVGATISVYAYNQMENQSFQFASDEKIIIEYGNKHETVCSAYLKDGKELEDCTVSVGGKTVRDKDYYQVGQYTLSLKWNDKEISKLLEVKDTTPPTFEDFKDKIEIEQGSEDIDLTNYFKANDLSNVKIEVEGDVEFNTAGTYEIKVKAIDEYKNTVEKVSSVIVTAIEEKEEASTPVTTTNIQGNASQNNAPTNNNGGYSTSAEAPQPTPVPEPVPTPQATPAPVPESAPAPQPPVNVCPVPDETYLWSNNSGMVFSTEGEAGTWAEGAVSTTGSPWDGYAFVVFPMGCSNGSPLWGVNMRYVPI